MEHPADVVVARDEPATLRCEAAGQPEPEIRWIIAIDFVFRRMFSFKVSIPERYENINSRTMKKCLFVLFMSRDITSRLVTELLLQ